MSIRVSVMPEVVPLAQRRSKYVRISFGTSPGSGYIGPVKVQRLQYETENCAIEFSRILLLKESSLIPNVLINFCACAKILKTVFRECYRKLSDTLIVIILHIYMIPVGSIICDFSV